MKGRYIVEQIAKFVITYSYNENKPISNLELQIYLFFIVYGLNIIKDLVNIYFPITSGLGGRE